ncbi:hypothetical protein [Micromonospora sp. Llam0]|uniref:hypothetical protein n=1 Tax=Micromonospora sp. Llam0 TaxID=2485143 RepID=UPI0013153913|nr:hypothetical protein [Micromonospora sp. Llam0]
MVKPDRRAAAPVLRRTSGSGEDRNRPVPALVTPVDVLRRTSGSGEDRNRVQLHQDGLPSIVAAPDLRVR